MRAYLPIINAAASVVVACAWIVALIYFVRAWRDMRAWRRSLRPPVRPLRREDRTNNTSTPS